jgi:hypothetical protein
MATADWLAATVGQPARPGQINQFLGAHGSTWVYSGNTLQAAQTIGTGVMQSSDGQYMAQSFATTTAQTTIGQVWLQLSTVGGSPTTATITPLTVSLYANLAGAPAGSALASVTMAEQLVYTGPFWLPVPLTATGLTSGTPYWLVVSPAGTSSAYYAWQQSNQTTGAALSTGGVTWTGQTFGFMFQVYDQSGGAWPPLTLTDDDGARVTVLSYSAAGQLATIAESVTAQGGGTFYSTRSLTYSGAYPTGVS